MKLTHALATALLMSAATAANAALVKVEDFKNLDGTMNTSNRYFETYSSPFTFTKAGTYSFDVVMTTNNNHTQGHMDFSLQYGSALGGFKSESKLPFSLRQVSVQGQQRDEYFATYQFVAKQGDTFVFQANFNPTDGATGKVDFNLSQAVAPVPEPETYALMGLGLAGLLAARRRKAKQVA